ncbi:MAG: heme-binding protein [Acetobacteraceae bacterium]
MRVIHRLAMICAGISIGGAAHAELIVHKDLSAQMALTIAETALTTCTANSYHVSVTVLGRAAEVIVQVRGDGASPHTMENSFRKAYTARTFRVASGEIAKRVKDDPQLFMIHLNNVIAAQGGLPIRVGDDVVGAVGVSGSPGGDKDEVCAKAGVDKVADELK